MILKLVPLITSLGEERANLSDFHMFVRFAFVWFCLFPLLLRVWDGLRLVSVALPGLFSYFFFSILKISWNERNNRTVPEDINKINPFMYERNFDKITFVITFRIDVRTKSMLSITCS